MKFTTIVFLFLLFVQLFAVSTNCNASANRNVLDDEEVLDIESSDTATLEPCVETETCQLQCSQLNPACTSVHYFNIGDLAQYPRYEAYGQVPIMSLEERSYNMICASNQNNQNAGALSASFVNQARRYGVAITNDVPNPDWNTDIGKVFTTLGFYYNILRGAKTECQKNNRFTNQNDIFNFLSKYDDGTARVGWDTSNFFEFRKHVQNLSLLSRLQNEAKVVFATEILSGRRSWCQCSELIKRPVEQWYINANGGFYGPFGYQFQKFINRRSKFISKMNVVCQTRCN